MKISNPTSDQDVRRETSPSRPAPLDFFSRLYRVWARATGGEARWSSEVCHSVVLAMAPTIEQVSP